MTPDGLTAVQVTDASAFPHLGWAEGMQFCLPTPLTNGNKFSFSSVRLPIEPEVVQKLRLRAAFTNEEPISSRMPVSYRRVPAWGRTLVASTMGRWKRRRDDQWAAFPKWPLDLSADFLSDLATGKPSRFAGGATPVVLSHDLDSPEGLENVVRHFLSAEESMGARSTNFIVPCGWPIQHGLLAEVKQRGHEIGVHGYDHANRTPFADPSERQKRLEAGRELIDRYEAIGYRAPSLLRTTALLKDLSGLYRYDSSIPTSGGLFPVPNNGCASARPFEVEGIVEIPISLPRDGSLRFLGYSPEAILRLWIDCAEKIARSGGVVVLLTHCEERFSGNTRMLDVYKRFLAHISTSGRFAWVTARSILDLYNCKS